MRVWGVAHILRYDLLETFWKRRLDVVLEAARPIFGVGAEERDAHEEFEKFEELERLINGREGVQRQVTAGDDT